MNQMAQGKANRLPQDASDPAVLMQGVNKWYGTYHALRDIDLNVARGERIVICGPSGSGSRPSSVVSISWRPFRKAASL